MSEKMGSNIETLLESDPYTLTKNEKGVIFLNSMKEAVSFHYEKSKEFRKICDNRGFTQTKKFSVEEIPFLPVSLFKKFKIKSVQILKFLKQFIQVQQQVIYQAPFFLIELLQKDKLRY